MNKETLIRVTKAIEKSSVPQAEKARLFNLIDEVHRLDTQKATLSREIYTLAIQTPSQESEINARLHEFMTASEKRSSAARELTHYITSLHKGPTATAVS